MGNICIFFKNNKERNQDNKLETNKNIDTNFALNNDLNNDLNNHDLPSYYSVINPISLNKESLDQLDNTY